MINYNYQYKYYQYKGNYREYRVPISKNIDNTIHRQEQIEFLRSLYPNGLNKQIN